MHFSFVKTVAANIFNAAFLAPDIATVPFNFFPPSIINLDKINPFYV
jgi:hypothetical protein